MELYGRVAQLGEHLLCKHAVISPKSLNRRLLTVQTPSVSWATNWATQNKGYFVQARTDTQKNGRREQTSDASRSVTSPENTLARTLQRVSGPFHHQYASRGD